MLLTFKSSGQGKAAYYHSHHSRAGATTASVVLAARRLGLFTAAAAREGYLRCLDVPRQSLASGPSVPRDLDFDRVLAVGLLSS